MSDAVRIHVFGRVQGVFYRQSTREKARLLELSGWVSNEADGSVLIEAHGEPTCLERLISWCGQGPPSAKVHDVKVEWMISRNPPAGFEIRG